jgi:hypothetical protein
MVSPLKVKLKKKVTRVINHHLRASKALQIVVVSALLRANNRFRDSVSTTGLTLNYRVGIANKVVTISRPLYQ